MSNSSERNNDLPSLRTVLPREKGGRLSRPGFDYQDHVGVPFVLQMLVDPDLIEIRFERHDDFVLVWRSDGMELFEFVQVKHEPIFAPGFCGVLAAA
jgi:hypothetical protein